MIWNTTSSPNTPDVSIPNTIYIGYDITRNYTNWKEPVVKYASYDLSAFNVDSSSYTSQIWSSYTFSSSTGEIRTTGSATQFKVSDLPVNVDGWLTSTDIHEVYHITRIEKAQTSTSSPVRYTLYYKTDRQAISTQNYTITYNSITSVSLSPRSGDKWKAISLYK